VLLPAPAVDTTTRRLDLLVDVDGSILAANANAARNFSVQFRMCFPEVAPDLTPWALFAQVRPPTRTALRSDSDVQNHRHREILLHVLAW
jgi:hypothetical protein